MSALRWLGIGLGLLLVMVVLVVGIGTVWVNNFIHSDAFRHTVEERASQSLGGVVKIDKIDFSPLEGVRLEGLATRIDASRVNTTGALAVNVAKIRCTYSWQELLNRRLELTGVTLDQPQIILTPGTAAPAAPTTPADSSPPSGTTADSGETASNAFQFVLDHARLNDGTVSIHDASGASLVDLTGLDVNADTSGYADGHDVNGTIKIGSLSLPSKLAVTGLTSSFVYGNGAFQAKPFQGDLLGGALNGGYALPASGVSVLDLSLKNVDVAQVGQALSPGSSARLTGSLDLQSKWRGIESGSLNGEGDAQVTNGKLEGVKLLEQLSSVLRINELRAPIIKEGHTHFVIANQQTQVIGLQLDTPICRITGDGTIGFNGQLNLSLVLILSRDGMTKLPKEAAASFVQQPDGTGSIAFNVTGTTGSPQTDLATRLLLQNTQIQNVLNKALNKFFH